MTDLKPSDQEIIARCRLHDHEAFSLLVARYQLQVRTFIAARCSQFDLIDEIVQDTFISAWEGIHKLQNELALQSWLCGIGRNKMLHALRERRGSQRLKPLDDNIIEMNIDQLEESYLDVGLPSPAQLTYCMGKLSTRSQKLVHARFEDGHNLKRLAQMFKKNHQALAKEVQRILKKVKICMESATHE